LDVATFALLQWGGLPDSPSANAVNAIQAKWRAQTLFM